MFPAEISEDPFVEIPHPDATARGDLEVLDSVAENQLLLELPTAIVESAVVLDVNFRPPMRPNAGQEKTVQKGLNKVNVVLLFPRKEVNDAIACASVIRKHAIRLRSIRASLGEHGPARLLRRVVEGFLREHEIHVGVEACTERDDLSGKRV
jgi:hypothetical protein